MKTPIYLIILSAFLCAGCSEPKKEAVQKVKYDIPFDGVMQDIKLEQLFKNISFLPLETNDSSLLGRLERIICKNGYIYIANYGSDGTEISLFKKDGHYIRKIGHLGNGPEEYLGFLNMNVSNDGNVSLGDRFRKSIVTYSSNGDFVSEIKMKSIPLRDMVYLNDTTMLIRSDIREEGDKFYVLDITQKKIINSYEPVSKRNLTCAFKDCFTTYNDKVLTCEYQSNEIVEVSKDSMSVRYIFNIGNKMPPKGFWDRDIPGEVLGGEYTKKGYIGHIPCFAESDNSMLFRFQGNPDETRGFAFVDKATEEPTLFKRLILADGVIIEPDFFFSRGDGKIIFLVLPTDILESGNSEFISRFPGLKEDDNPILLFAEIK